MTSLPNFKRRSLKCGVHRRCSTWTGPQHTWVRRGRGISFLRLLLEVRRGQPRRGLGNASPPAEGLRRTVPCPPHTHTPRAPHESSRQGPYPFSSEPGLGGRPQTRAASLTHPEAAWTPAVSERPRGRSRRTRGRRAGGQHATRQLGRTACGGDGAGPGVPQSSGRGRGRLPAAPTPAASRKGRVRREARSERERHRPEWGGGGGGGVTADRGAPRPHATWARLGLWQHCDCKRAVCRGNLTIDCCTILSMQGVS